MAAQPSPQRIVRVARRMSTARDFVDDEVAGSGSNSSAPYLYECNSNEFLVEDL